MRQLLLVVLVVMVVLLVFFGIANAEMPADIKAQVKVAAVDKSTSTKSVL